MKKIYKERIADGKCPRCGQPPKVGIILCEVCSEKAKFWCRNKLQRWKKDGKCVKCGCKEVVDGLEGRKTKICKSCFFKNASVKYFGNFSKWKQLEDLFDSQNQKCSYTGIKLTIGINAHLDHIIARNSGGVSEIDNLQWTHAIVNRMKSDFTEEQFLEFVCSIYQHRMKTNEIVRS